MPTLPQEPTATPEAAWESTLLAQARRLYRIAYGVLRDPAEAEDAVQDALQRAWRHRTRAAQIENPAAWLARIAWRAALARRRRPAPVSIEELNEIHELRAAGASAEELAARHEMQHLLEAVLNRLPAKLRQPLLLSTVEELSTVEIAYVLGISESAVRGRCLRARRLLQEKCQALVNVHAEVHHAR